MALPLPYRVVDPVEAEPIQGNLDHLAKQFPLTRKAQSIEVPNQVGVGANPAFQNSWVNYDTTTFYGLRYWKDPMDIVHIEGLIKLGTIGTTIFTLPAGYRPTNGHLFVVISNGAIGRVDIAPTGNVVATAGNNTYLSLSGINFKQEA